MADDAAPSPPDRIRALPFSVVLALGGLSGLLAAAAAALTVEPGPAKDTPQTAKSEAPDPAPHVEPEAPVDAGGGAASGEPTHGADTPPPTEPDPEELDATANAGFDEADEEEEEEVEMLAEPDVGGDAPGAAAEDAPEESGATADVVPTAKSADRAAEAEATPEELFTMAQAAYDEGEYRDAYRLATRSQRAKASDRTQVLRGRAACHLKDEKNAKAIVRSFKLGDDRRKALRGFCKDRGVRVGL
ncbi:MAG: hypothetical protein ACE37F_12505 [Nannocystaceae bacterium]|nr:hypothetical protein [bacterium]